MTRVEHPPTEEEKKERNKISKITVRKETSRKPRILEKELPQQKDRHLGEPEHPHVHAELYWGETTPFVCDRTDVPSWDSVLFQIGALHLATRYELEELIAEDETMTRWEFETSGPDSPFAVSGGRNWIAGTYDWTPLVEAGEEVLIESPRVDSDKIKADKHYCYKFTWKVKCGGDTLWDPHIIVHGEPPGI